MGSKVDQRTQIVQAAFRVLKASGLPHLSFDAIATEAGYSRQRVRYYYSNAEDLMVDLCDALADAYRKALVDNATRLEGVNRLDMFLDFYFGLLDGVEKPRDDQVYDAMMSLAAGSPRIREALRGQYTLLGQVLCHEFRVAHPHLSLPACEELAYLFVCLMYGHWKMVASLGLSAEHNRITRAAMERLIRDFATTGPTAGPMIKIWAKSD